MTDKNQLELECVLGLTCSSPFSVLTLDDEQIIYPAGAAAVKYNYVNDKQVSHLIAQTAPKSISCLSKSPDASLVVVGESGHQPRILVYEINQEKLVASLVAHRYGILTAAFSPDMLFLVSIGFHHDGFIYLWEWKTRTRLCGFKMTSPLFSLAFDPFSSYFVTCGVKHIKFWDLKAARERIGNGSSQRTVVSNDIPSLFSLEGKSGFLGEHKGVTLIDICCINSLVEESMQTFTYALTLNGYLLMFNSSGTLEKWLHAKMEKGSCIQATSGYIICGGSEGKVRLFEPVTLKHLGNISTPDPLLPPSSDIDNDFIKIFPQIVCIQALTSAKIVIVYSNMTILITDLHGVLKDPKIYCKILNHSDCIWGVQPFTINPDPNSSHIERDGFITYSSDGSVRFWDSSLLDCSNRKEKSHQTPKYITTLMADPKGAKKFQYFDRFGSSNDIKSVTERTGIRSFAIDPQKNMIACGDRNGTIGIYTFDTLRKIASIEAHDAEIMVLDFAVLGTEEALVLASASRDRLIHVFDAESREGIYPFDLLQTLDDHSSTLTSILFADSGSKLISCGADKAIIFRSVQDDINLNFATYRNTPLRSTVYDMALAQVSRHIITASQDKRITILDIDSGKPVKSFASSLPSSDSSSKAPPFLNTLTTDPTGSIICAGASDKSVHLLDIQTGTSLFYGLGHGDLVTNVAFINHGSHVISTSADGCIFIWKVPESIIKKMGYLPNISIPKLPNPELLSDANAISPLSPGQVFQFEESHLPPWARSSEKTEIISSEIVQHAKGRWAERVNREGVKLHSDLPVKETIIANPWPESKRYDITSYSQGALLIEGKYISAADISIHVVDPLDILTQAEPMSDSEQRIHVDPFADSIETDSEGAFSEVLDFSEGPVMNSGRHSNSRGQSVKSESRHNSPSRETSSSKAITESLFDLVDHELGNQELCQTPTHMDHQELDLFYKLALKTASVITSMASNNYAIETLKKVQIVASNVLGKNTDEDKIQILLEKYSEKLAEMVSAKLQHKTKDF